MTTYAVLLPGDEAVWEAATADEREQVYARHTEFARLLAERGHRITGGAELTHSRTGKVVRSTSGAGADAITVTDGPYAETVEQLTGFYLVESDDLDDLLQLCGLLAGRDGGVEVRAVVEAPAAGGDQQAPAAWQVTS
ncbi:transcription initiation protein [Auraticoccus sp. F435]|uniref:Transcription initiation protein n=1 Tax=Auraticoccus cholistanensis TaxID=2656650 RepID=A0A6A9UVR3_9ACTN|nr:YciI family protein [Auraticoccus cholistanensis]MVA75775.1 transcription initiation protein [Auraticoccus cholistanensis]